MKNEIDYKLFLEPSAMIELYAQGAFPMAEDDGKIYWYMPDLRAIIPLDGFNVPRSLAQFMKTADFEYRFDTDKIKIIRECANREKTWISEELIEAYKGLEKSGHIHCVGVYRRNKLVGGLYGVTYRGAFFGESMFSLVSQASKSALVKLIERLKQKGFALLDVQFMTEHLRMFGAKEISFYSYGRLLRKAHKINAEF